MEVTGQTIPLQREPVREMQRRFGQALAGTYDPASDDFVPEEERTKSLIRRHLFDFMDGMRLHVSRHQSEEGPVIHAYARWFSEEEKPDQREVALRFMEQRLTLLIEGLPGVDEAVLLDYGMSENDVPHVFFRYPLAYPG